METGSTHRLSNVTYDTVDLPVFCFSGLSRNKRLKFLINLKLLILDKYYVLPK